MLFLLVAMLASTSILICFKIFSKIGIDDTTAITTNYLVGALLGFNSISQAISFEGIISSPWFFLSFMMGFILTGGFLLFALSTRQVGVAITSISSRISVVISVLLGILVFGDKLGALKIAGIVLTFLSFFLIFRKEKSVKPSAALLVIPLLVFLLSGMNDSTLKIAQHYFIENNETDYIRYAATSFSFAFLLCIPLVLYRKSKGEAKPDFKSVIAGIVLGILNWYSIYFMLNGLKVMEVSVFFPILNIGVVTLSTIAGYFIFKEKLLTVNLIGIFTAIIAIVLITLQV